jgi:hypothetical protein
MNRLSNLFNYLSYYLKDYRFQSAPPEQKINNSTLQTNPFLSPHYQDAGQKVIQLLVDRLNDSSFNNPIHRSNSLNFTSNQQKSSAITEAFALPEGYQAKGKEVDRDVLTLVYIHRILMRNGINPTWGEVEAIAERTGKIDFSAKINKDGKVVDDVTDGYWVKATKHKDVNGREFYGYQSLITADAQRVFVDRYRSLPADVRDRKAVVEMGLSERIYESIKRAWDAGYITREAKEQVGATTAEEFAAAVAIGTVVGYAARSKYKAALGPIGAGMAMSSFLSSTLDLHELMVQSANAKTRSDIDQVARWIGNKFGQAAHNGVLGAVGGAAARYGPELGKLGGNVVGEAEEELVKSYKWIKEGIEDAFIKKEGGLVPAGGPDIGPVTGVPTRRVPIEDIARPHEMAESDRLEFLKGGSKAGREVLSEVAEEGLSEISRASLKRIKRLSKEGAEKAKQALITLNTARTELMARLNLLEVDPSLRPETKGQLLKTYNSVKDHMTQEDLIGALRDKLNLPIRKSGSGYIYSHEGEVGTVIDSLRKSKETLLREMRTLSKDSDQYRRLSKEVDAISETERRVREFLEIK